MRKIALLKRLTIAAGLWATTLAAPTPARAEVILFQNFDDVSALAGWTRTNNSADGVTNWFQGNEGVFPSQDGAPDSYIAANFLNAGAGAISNWLILPELTYAGGDSLSFFTRSGGALADRLEVRFSANGSSSNVGSTVASVGDFTTLFLTINPALNPGGYPSDWTQYDVSLASLVGTSGRLAFRYSIDDVGFNGDYIGIDTVTVNRVPEPATLALMGLGLVGLVARRRRSSALPLQRGA